MRVPGTSENQYCQFYEIHHFCSIFTFEYYTVAQKHIRQSYSSVNQHFMAYQRKLMSREHVEKMYSLFDHKKVFLLQRKSVKTISDKIYGLFHLLFDTYASNICPIKCPRNIKSPGDTRIKCTASLATKKYFFSKDKL